MASTLGGNWLLVGSLPPFFPPQGAAPTAFAMSVQVQGNALVAVASLETTCTSGTTSGGDFSVLEGTVAADGSFTLSLQPAISGVSLSVSGNVPATEGAGWAGKYSYTDTSSPPCTLDASGAFQATPVADIEGTYSGQGPLEGYAGSLSPLPSTGTVFGFTETLQQGAPLPPSTVESAIGLSGSIQTTGFPCFSKGQMSTALGGIVEGNDVLANFTMDDGSTLSAYGAISNISSSVLTISLVEVAGGSCSGDYLFVDSPIAISH